MATSFILVNKEVPASQLLTRPQRKGNFIYLNQNPKIRGWGWCKVLGVNVYYIGYQELVRLLLWPIDLPVDEVYQYYTTDTKFDIYETMEVASKENNG